MNLANRFVLSPKGSSGTLWVHLAWEGKDPDYPATLPDGSDWEERLITEGFSALSDDIWLEPWSSGRLVDWLWPGLSERVFSERMLSVFHACDVQGIEALPMTIRCKRNPDIEGYYLVRFTGEDERVGYFPEFNPYAWDIIVTSEIKDALVAAKLTGFKVTPAQLAWQELQEEIDS